MNNEITMKSAEIQKVHRLTIERAELATRSDLLGGSSLASMRTLGPFGDDGWIFSDVLRSIVNDARISAPLHDDVAAYLRGVFHAAYVAKAYSYDED